MTGRGKLRLERPAWGPCSAVGDADARAIESVSRQTGVSPARLQPSLLPRLLGGGRADCHLPDGRWGLFLSLLPQETKGSVAVRVALGETQLVQEVRRFLIDNGVSLDSFSQVGSCSGLSKPLDCSASSCGELGADLQIDP